MRVRAVCRRVAAARSSGRRSAAGARGPTAGSSSGSCSGSRPRRFRLSRRTGRRRSRCPPGPTSTRGTGVAAGRGSAPPWACSEEGRVEQVDAFHAGPKPDEVGPVEEARVRVHLRRPLLERDRRDRLHAAAEERARPRCRRGEPARHGTADPRLRLAFDGCIGRPPFFTPLPASLGGWRLRAQDRVGPTAVDEPGQRPHRWAPRTRLPRTRRPGSPSSLVPSCGPRGARSRPARRSYLVGPHPVEAEQAAGGRRARSRSRLRVPDRRRRAPPGVPRGLFRFPIDRGGGVGPPRDAPRERRRRDHHLRVGVQAHQQREHLATLLGRDRGRGKPPALGGPKRQASQQTLVQPPAPLPPRRAKVSRARFAAACSATGRLARSTGTT